MVYDRPLAIGRSYDPLPLLRLPWTWNPPHPCNLQTLEPDSCYPLKQPWVDN